MISRRAFVAGALTLPWVARAASPVWKVLLVLPATQLPDLALSARRGASLGFTSPHATLVEVDTTSTLDVVQPDLGDDGVIAAIGPMTSYEAKTWVQHPKAESIPLLLPTATLDGLTSGGNAAFQLCSQDSMQGERMAAFAKRFRRVAAVFDHGSSYSSALISSFQKVHRKNTFPSTPDTEVDAVKAALKTKPKALYLPTHYVDALRQAEIARKLGFQGVFLGGDGWDSAITFAPDSPLKGGYFTNHFHPDVPAAAAFVTRYREAHVVEPDAIAALYFDAAKRLSEALHRAYVEDLPFLLQNLRLYLASTPFDSTSGQAYFQDDHSVVRPLVVLRVEAGRFAYEESR